MQRHRIIHRFRRLTECGRGSEFPVGARLLGLHALPWGAETGPTPPPIPRGVPNFDLSAQGITRSPQIDTKTQECEHVMHPGVPWAVE